MAWKQRSLFLRSEAESVLNAIHFKLLDPPNHVTTNVKGRMYVLTVLLSRSDRDRMLLVVLQEAGRCVPEISGFFIRALTQPLTGELVRPFPHYAPGAHTRN